MAKREACDLEPGERLNIAGIICTISKVEEIFHYAPKTTIRLELQIKGLQGQFSKLVLFIPRGSSVSLYQGKK